MMGRTNQQKGHLEALHINMLLCNKVRNLCHRIRFETRSIKYCHLVLLEDP